MQRNDDFPLSMHENVTLNSPRDEEYNHQYQKRNLQYNTPFSDLILNNFCKFHLYFSSFYFIYSPLKMLLDSPYDSILCPTTNLLVEIEDNDEENEIWRSNFLDLISTVITYSENLESISTELLRTEGKVRELVLLQKSLTEELEEKEKLYQERIDECEEISNQQLDLIDHLIELETDLSFNRQDVSNQRSTTTTTLSTIYRWQSSEHGQEERSLNSDTTVNSKFLLSNDNKNDIINTLRWQVGLWIGGGVGTGNIVHSFESPSGNGGIELIVSGSGTIASPRHHVSCIIVIMYLY